MGEFAMLHHEEDPVDEDFHAFRKKHKREYKDKTEHQKRKHIFRHNLRFVNEWYVMGRQKQPVFTPTILKLHLNLKIVSWEFEVRAFTLSVANFQVLVL